MPVLYALVFIGLVLFAAGALPEVMSPMATGTTRATGSKAAKKREPVGMIVSPRLGVGAIRVQVRVWSDQPGLTCPSLKIEWAEGTTSFRESDCDPEDEPETFSFFTMEPAAIWSWRARDQSHPRAGKAAASSHRPRHRCGGVNTPTPRTRWVASRFPCP